MPHPHFARLLAFASFAFFVVPGSVAQNTSSYVFTTFAGHSNRGTADGTGTAAQFNTPHGIAIDASGALVVTDGTSNTIRRVSPAGVVTTFIGLAGAPIASVDGTGGAARFGVTGGVVIDGAGNIYVSDALTFTIRRITPAGVVTTLAGPGGALDISNAGSVDGTGSAARFNFPLGLALDSGGNLFVADRGNHTIRKITPGGVVTTFAGSAGNGGSANGTGAGARFNGPAYLAMDGAGNIYVTDQGNNTIRKITSAGVVTTFAGTAGSSGSTNGTGSAARFNSPNGVALDSVGNLYVSEFGNCTIRKITSAGVVTTLAGTPGSKGAADGPGSAAQFRGPEGLTVDGAGNLYVVDGRNASIRKITPGGVVTTVAGQSKDAFSLGSTDGTGTAARFSDSGKVAIDSAGNLYVCDAGNDTVRKITPAGVVTTLAGQPGSDGTADGTGNAARFNAMQGITVDAAGNLFVADNSRIRKITPEGVVTTFAGGATGSVNGTGTSARFSGPMGEIAIDSDGNLYVADTGNHIIRRVTPGAVVTTFAGLSGSSGTVDGTGGSARFNSPVGIAVDAAKNVYVADDNGRLVRKITSAGVVTTLAGASVDSLGVDGTGTSARLSGVRGLAADAAGNVFAGDYNDYTVRKITPSGVVTTIGGAVQVDGTTDGPGAAARFGGPLGIAVDSSGNLYVADTDTNTIRKGTLTASPVITAQPLSQVVNAGTSVALATTFSGSPTPTIQWSRNGVDVGGATSSTLTIDNVQPSNAGVYRATIVNSLGAATTGPAVVGISSTSKLIGPGTEFPDILHPATGFTYDQILLQGAAATVTADSALNQILRISYIDLNDDIVQVEFAGPGALTLVLDNVSGPATPLKYNQSVAYMKGHAGIVVTGATESTNLSIFSVGTLVNGNPALYRSDVTYDGFADLAFVAISSANGKFGGLRGANASYFATKGFTGVYAPGVEFTGPVFVGDINASDAATPVLMIGAGPDTRITGGDLLQSNGRAVQVSGLTQLKFAAGTNSHGVAQAAQTNKARLEQNGIDVTSQIAVNPTP